MTTVTKDSFKFYEEEDYPRIIDEEGQKFT